MNIKTRLYISAGISIVLVVALVSMVLVTSGRIAEENKKHQLLMDVYESISELNIVTYEYLLHREKRMEHQWNIKHDSLGEILDGLVEEERLKSIRADYTTLGNLFSQITANYEERQKYIQDGASQEKIDTLTGQEERLVAQLLITSHSIITDASRLTEEANAEATEAQRLALNLIVILMIVLAIVITTSSLIITRSISKPLTRLADYSRRVEEGEYTADIEIKGKDEVASVTSDVKSMVVQLQKHREHLEELVKERTAELTKANQHLRQQIEERKRVEEALRESENGLAEAQRIAHTGNWDLDLVKNELKWSDEIYRIFGLKPQEFGATYEAFLNAVHPDDREFVDTSYTKSVKSNAPYDIVHRIVRPDGEVRWVHEKAENIKDETGKMIRSIGTIQDITERKKAEDALNKSTGELREMVNLMAGREVRMAELKEVIQKLRTQVEETGLTPVADDPLKEI